MRRLFSSRLRVASIVGTAAIAAAAAIVAISWPAGETTSRHWREILGRTDDALVLTRLRELAHHSDAHAPALLALLDDDRPAVARAARRLLHEKIDAWRALPARQSSPKVDRLARSLAAQAEGFGPAGRRAAAEIAERILLWPLDEDRVDAPQVIAHCETIIRGGLADPPEGLMATVEAESLRHGASAGLPLRLAAPRAASPPQIEAAPLPGGGLPIEPEQVAARPPAVERMLKARAANSPAEDRTQQGPPAPIYAPLAIPLKAADRPQDDRSSQPEDDENHTRANRAAAIVDPALRELEDLALMRQLHAADNRTAVAAADELRRRGFDARALQLAARLTHPDPLLRLELAEALPQLAGINPTPWLMHLARDDDARVRRTAIAILGSGSDGDIDAWLQQMRQRERDPRIARLIGELLEKRR